MCTLQVKQYLQPPSPHRCASSAVCCLLKSALTWSMSLINSNWDITSRADALVLRQLRNRLIKIPQPPIYLRQTWFPCLRSSLHQFISRALTGGDNEGFLMGENYIFSAQIVLSGRKTLRCWSRDPDKDTYQPCANGTLSLLIKMSEALVARPGLFSAAPLCPCRSSSERWRYRDLRPRPHNAIYIPKDLKLNSGHIKKISFKYIFSLIAIKNKNPLIVQ